MEMDSEISVGFSGSVVNADNYREVRRQLSDECGDGRHMIHVSEETCRHLPKCFEIWERDFGSGGEGGDVYIPDDLK